MKENAIRDAAQIVPRAFPGISPEEAKEILAGGEVKNHPAGEILCHEGADEDTFYIILQGEVEVTKVINNREARFLKRLGPGDFFGEMALIHNAPRAATVKAVTPLVALEINRQAFERILKRSSSVSLALVREISRRLRENDEMAIEDLRARARELAEAYQKLAEEEVWRREFLTNIAHHLRTPLTAVNGYLHFLQRGAIPPDQIPNIVTIINQQVQQIITLINDILFLQEMDLVLGAFQPVDVVALSREVIGAFAARAEQNRVILHIESKEKPCLVSGDAASLGRVLSALVDNAIKFSPEGGDVKIAICRQDEWISIAVTDQGIGIEPEELPRLFERYYHLDRKGERVFGGIGLGLAVTRQVIQQHGGKIEVTSTPGVGSTFTIWLKKIE